LILLLCFIVFITFQLLVCESSVSADDLNRSIRGNTTALPNELVSMFITPDDGLRVQDRFVLEADKGRLIGVQVPQFFFVKSGSDGSSQSALEYRVMRDFVGLDSSDSVTIAAMLEFSYFLTVGNVDEAFRAVQSIKSPTVWHNMARMCVITKRMDVATVCMGNMRNVIGARALREAQKEPELEARVAALAIQLGTSVLMNVVMSLFGRHVRRGRVALQGVRPLRPAQQALPGPRYVGPESAGCQGERSHPSPQHILQASQAPGAYRRGRLWWLALMYLSYALQRNLAVELYEKSQTHGFEVPRVLFDDLNALEAFIKPSHNKVGIFFIRRGI
jgi:intraflagellar transport protein 140